jgi:SAM-dependent methyltransferase
MRSSSPDTIVQLGFGFFASKTFLSAVELGLFTELARAPLDCDSLRQRLQLHPRAARDFFDALVALGWLERNDGIYSNMPAVSLYLDRNKATYLGGIFEMASARLFRYWASLTEALRTGQPQNEVKHGGDPFKHLYADPQALEGFLKAMSSISIGPSLAIAAKFPWQNYRTFIDIGCAQGASPVHIARLHAHLTGGGFDLPQVRPVFERYVTDNGLSDRLGFYPGSFFEAPLPSADVLTMGHILHDWNLEQKQLLLAKAYAALPVGGALIVYESLIDDARRENAAGLLMSLNMLIETHGGFDYTGQECMQWMRAAGFSETRVEHLVGPTSMVVGIK